MTNGAHVSGKPLCLCAPKQPTSDEGLRDRHRVGFPRQTQCGEKHSSRSKYIFYRTLALRWTWEENFCINKALSWAVLSVELELNNFMILEKWMSQDILCNIFQMYSSSTNEGLGAKQQTHILPLWQHSTSHPVTCHAVWPLTLWPFFHSPVCKAQRPVLMWVGSLFSSRSSNCGPSGLN